MRSHRRGRLRRATLGALYVGRGRVWPPRLRAAARWLHRQAHTLPAPRDGIQLGRQDRLQRTKRHAAALPAVARPRLLMGRPQGKCLLRRSTNSAGVAHRAPRRPVRPGTVVPALPARMSAGWRGLPPPKPLCPRRLPPTAGAGVPSYLRLRFGASPPLFFAPRHIYFHRKKFFTARAMVLPHTHSAAGACDGGRAWRHRVTAGAAAAVPCLLRGRAADLRARARAGGAVCPPRSGPAD